MNIELFSLGTEFNETQARVCTFRDVKMISIMDVVTTTGGWTRDTASHAIVRLKDEHPEVFAQCEEYQFPGRGQKPTLVANIQTAIEIVLLLPSKRAREYRKKAVQALLNLMSPTEEFILQVTERFEAQQDGIKDHNMLINRSDKVTSLASRAYNETHVYVRIRYPDEFVQEVDNRKALTLDIIKFGITYNLNDRHKQYNQDEGDNGYMIFSHQFNSRPEAEIIENILKVDFNQITVGGSREYVDTTELARILDVPFDPTSYVSYVELSETLFRYIIKLTRKIWPDRYEGRGYVYDIIESTPKFVNKLTTQCQVIQERVKTEVTFVKRTLEVLNSEDSDSNTATVLERTKYLLDDERRQLLAEKRAHAATQQRIVDLQREIDALRSQGCTVTPSQKAKATRDMRSSGEVVSRDLVTGGEIVFASVEKAANSVNFTPRSLRRTYLNKARQLRGKHWRTRGMPYWIPPKGYLYDPDTVDKNFIIYIQAVNTEDDKDVRIYGSCESAADMLQLDRRTLNTHVHNNGVFGGFRWSFLPTEQSGQWSNGARVSTETIGSEIEAEEAADEVEASGEEEVASGKDGRCDGKVIARNLRTGEEVTYRSINAAGQIIGVCARSLSKSFLNQAKQVKGIHLRSYDSKRYWQPPANFRYDPETWQKKSGGYIVSESVDGERCLYESVTAAADMGVIERWRLQDIKDKGTEWEGRVWRSATPDEVETWVDIPE